MVSYNNHKQTKQNSVFMLDFLNNDSQIERFCGTVSLSLTSELLPLRLRNDQRRLRFMFYKLMNSKHGKYLITDLNLTILQCLQCKRCFNYILKTNAIVTVLLTPTRMFS